MVLIPTLSVRSSDFRRAWNAEGEGVIVAFTLQVLKSQLAAKEQGYDDVIYLDAVSDTYLEEVSSCNIFTVKGDTIRTPPLKACPPPSPHTHS